jgi:hypothetical protein
MVGGTCDAADIYMFTNGFEFWYWQRLLVSVLRTPSVPQLAVYPYNTDPNFLLINEIFACI